MFFEGSALLPGVWDADEATWRVGVGEVPDPDGSLLAAIEEGLGWDPEVPPEFVVAEDEVFDADLVEVLAECELALESAARDEPLVGGWAA